MKRFLTAALVAAVSILTGCAGDKEFLRAQAESITAQSKARVAEAQAAAEDAKAVTALAAKASPSGADAALLVRSLKGLGLGGAAQRESQVKVDRPRDFLDYLQAFTSVAGTIGNIAVPIITVKEQGKTSRAGFDRDVRIESARQAGESTRIQSVGEIASSIAARPPNVTTITTTNNTLSGNGVIGNGTYTGPVTRTCNGGTAAPGGNGGNATTGPAGSGAPGGSANAGVC